MNKFDSKSYVFASYSHSNKAEVEKYISIIKETGFNIIYDDDENKGLYCGDEWDIKVRKYISSVNCKGVIVFISEEAAISKPVLYEIDYTRLYHKNYMAIIMDGSDFQQMFHRVREKFSNDDNKCFISETISNYFPKEKIYLKGSDLEQENGIFRIKKLFIEWGLFQTWQSSEDYIRTSDSEKARLQTQANGYKVVDEKVIGEVMDKFDKNDLVVIDLGCADGSLTFSRFSNNRKIKTVIGFDIKSEDIAKANEKAIEKGLSNTFLFYELDFEGSDAVDKMKEIMTNLKIKSVDIIFCALIIHYIKNAERFLTDIHGIISKKGKIVLRGSDDGAKIAYPDSELLDSIIDRYRKYSASDRYNGRKFYYQLMHAGFRNIKLIFEPTDTSEYDKDYREAAFRVGMDFRIRRMESLIKQNPQDEMIKEDYEWMHSAIEQLEKRFYEQDFWYFLINFIAIAEP